MGVSARDVVEISSDEEEEEPEDPRPGKLYVSPGRLGWMAKLFADVVVVRGKPEPPALPPQKKDGGGGGDDDFVVLDGDPDPPVAVAGGKGSAGGGGSDEVEIVAEKGQIACRDFPHSRHLCSQLPFNTTSHVKHCSMCYCFVCDAPAPCKYWGNGLTIDDHCHATDKEIKWKTLRQEFKRKSLPASHPEKHQNVVYPTMSPRQQEYEEEEYAYEYDEYEEEEYAYEYEEYEEEYAYEDEEYYESDEATLYVGNLPYDIDDWYLAQLFEHAGIVEFSEILYDSETGQSRGSGYVIMNTVEEAEMAVKMFHRMELYGRLVTVEKAFAPGARVARAEEMSSPHQHRYPSFRIYVGNLPWEVDDSMLKLLFSEYGEVVDAKVVYGYVKGAWCSRGFGFVTMAAREESETAIWYLHRQIWKGRQLRVAVATDVARRG